MPRRTVVVLVAAALTAAVLLVTLAARPARPPPVTADPPAPSATGPRCRARSSSTSTRRRARGRPATGASTTTPAPGTPVVAPPTARSSSPGTSPAPSTSPLRHADGLRTSYSFLAEVSVVARRPTRPGRRAGRRGGRPGALRGARPATAPTSTPRPCSPARSNPTWSWCPGARRASTRWPSVGACSGWSCEAGVGAVTRVGEGARDRAQLLAHEAWLLSPQGRLRRGLGAFARWYDQRSRCTPTSVAAPPVPGRRIAVLVSGLGTGSDGNSAWEIRTDDLGYARDGPLLLRRGSVAGPGGAARPQSASGGPGAPTVARSVVPVTALRRGRHPAAADHLGRPAGPAPRPAGRDRAGGPHRRAGPLPGRGGGAPRPRPGRRPRHPAGVGADPGDAGLPPRRRTARHGHRAGPLGPRGSRWPRAGPEPRPPGPRGPRRPAAVDHGDGRDLSGARPGPRPPAARRRPLRVPRRPGGPDGAVGGDGRRRRGDPHPPSPGLPLDPREPAVERRRDTREIALAVAGMGPTCQGLLDAAADVVVGDVIMAGESVAGLGLDGAASLAPGLAGVGLASG